MTSQPRRGRPLWLAAIALLAGAASPGQDFVAQGREALAKGDGISAEVALRRALSAGVPREAVAAYMGEALLDQDAPDKARDWLAPGEFTKETAALGFRRLAQLERVQGNLAAAGEAFDEALAITPRDATMWVEIGRLRYVGGEHVLAIEAADYALRLDPDNVRALEFKGQLVRDSQGLTAGLPWFERALRHHPRDMAVLGEYAATLGDLGRARKMLDVTRQMLAIEPGNPRAYFLQAVMAARAGKAELARGLFARTKDEFDDTPAGQLLEGVLELEVGNYVLAAEALQKLVRAQPGNARAAQLLARAYALAGENALVVHDNADAAARPEASPYMLTLVARAYEAEGRRDLAAPLLDRAAQGRWSMQPRQPMLWPIAAGSEVGGLLAVGNVEGARALADARIATNPGSAFNRTIAGDVRLAAGDGAGALEHYQLASYVRLSQFILLKTVAASSEAGRNAAAAALIETFLAANPDDPVAARMAANEAAMTGDWRRARILLEHVRDSGGASDSEVLADLSIAQLRSGDAKAAEATARAAYRLQPNRLNTIVAWEHALRGVTGSEALRAALNAKALKRGSRAPI